MRVSIKPFAYTLRYFDCINCSNNGPCAPFLYIAFVSMSFLVLLSTYGAFVCVCACEYEALWLLMVM